ncbi:Glucose-6-phosphate 3-dehydrogenase [Pseudovibrio sp. Ad5]|uniref:Gfo/Idh/MocA family protein n=1 Tax=unclassified Pseudovibrio TaxID=2627060 RepID=UPI00070E400E|nr:MULTISPECIES: Gfo/Idh/MocA family oxidoreductase [unclassified Pseudovibrio]KZK93655.1 Glucose-6-phosphate 3-dehydrogenase [Pseudovibrio sp. Ad5]
MTKLNWGLIGGGEGSQIGPAHRLGASVDGLFQLAAGALDADAAKGRMFAQSLGIAEDRAYGDWQEMLAVEKTRSDKVDLVTIATPNATHFEITKAFLEGGFHVLCEKPMTMTVEEGEEIVKISRRTGKKCAVNFGYSGFSLVRQMREMIAAGDLGDVRLVKAEFAHGFHADAADADNPRVRWRYDPAAAGVSAVLADAGIHALHMACFVTGQEVSTVSADFASTIASRELEDDAMINFRMDGGAVGRLWTSAVAVGRMHGLSLQVFGEKGGLAWQQEHPNQLYYTPLNGRTQIIERGAGDLYNAAQNASRVTIGHSEGMPLAFANIYCDLAEMIHADKASGSSERSAFLFPSCEDGLRSMASVYAAVKSAHAAGAWQDAVPALLK